MIHSSAWRNREVISLFHNHPHAGDLIFVGLSDYPPLFVDTVHSQKKTYQQHINNISTYFAIKPSLAQQLEMLEFKLHL